jgi:hypothetical protein
VSGPYLAVVAIRPDPSAAPSIGPAGYHLRWSFPAEKGFPPKGFRVYRRPAGKTKLDCRDFADAAKGRARVLPPVWSVDGIRLRVPEGLTLTAEPGRPWLDCAVRPRATPPVLRIAFDPPAVAVELRVRDLRGPSAPVLRAFDARGRLAAQSGDAIPVDSGGTRAIRVSGPLIARVDVPVTFSQLHAVCCLTVERACQGEWGEATWLRLLSPPAPEDAENLVREVLGPDTRNRYAASLEDAVKRYGKGARDLLRWQAALLDGTGGGVIENPEEADPRARVTRPRSGKPVLQLVRPQAILLLAALDPNIARLLRLAWVDRDVKLRPADAKDAPVYDYKVVGVWANAELCGVALEVGRAVADVPRLRDSGTAFVLPGIRWPRREPRRRVGVHWPEPPGPTAHGAATRAVLFDVSRRDAASDWTRLTESHPALVPDDTWREPATPCLVDTDVPLGTYVYRVGGIDLFGQVGPPAEPTNKVEVADIEAPPPPARLALRLAQPGYPWRTASDRGGAGSAATLHVTFEYGPFQDRAAPDVAEFILYWRQGSLAKTRIVTITDVTSRRVEADGRTVYSGTATDVSAAELARFVRGVLSNHTRGGPPVGPTLKTQKAAERRRWRLAGVEADTTRFETAPSNVPLTSGTYRLATDPHDRSGWTELARVPARQPIVGVVRRFDDSRSVAFRRIPEPAPVADPLVRLPPGRRAAEPPPAATVEVSIAQAVLEPDVFVGGTATIGGAVFPVVASTPGVADDGAGEAPPPRSTRLRLEASGSAVPASGTLTLTAPPPDPDTARGALRWLEIDGAVPASVREVPGGELGFEVPRDGDPLVAAQVLSPVEPGSARFRVLARFAASLPAAALPVAPAGAGYFAPYAVSIPLAVASGDGPVFAGPPRIDIPATEGTASAYVAVSATDHRYRAEASGPGDARWDANQGPLSAPAQAIAVRPPPSGTPSAPFPCGHPGATNGYATPPDRQDRATVCVEWTAGSLAPASGLRWEVARALDAAIVAADRRRWLQGAAAVDPVLSRARLAGTVVSVQTEPAGTVRVRVEAPPGDAGADRFVGGRLVQGTAAFPVMRASFWQEESAFGGRVTCGVELSVRATGPGTPAAGGCFVDELPNYDEVAGDAAAVRTLASRPENSDAFALVTGVPIAGTRFIDQVPGVGRSRFFYRVRAVDAAENRSEWSTVSAPFHQVDTTPPRSPRIVEASGGDRQATLRWAADPDPRVVGYAVYRVSDPGELRHPRVLTPLVELVRAPEPGQALLRLASLVRRLDTVDLSGAAGLPAGLGLGPARPRVTAVHPRGADGEPDRSLNGLVPAPTRIEGRRVVGVNGALGDATPIVIVATNEAGERLLLSRDPRGEGPARVQAGAVDFGFPWDIADVLGVFRASGFDAAVPGLVPQRVPDLSTDAVAFDPATRTVTGLVADAPEDEPLVVVIAERQPGGETRATAVHGRVAVDLPCVNHGGTIALDVPFVPTLALGVYRADAFGGGRPAEGALDYHLPAASTYDPQRRLIRRLNPVLPEGAPVVVVVEDASGTEAIVRDVMGLHEFVDAPLAVTSPDTSWSYALVTLARATTGPGEDDHIDLRSVPSEVGTLRVFDAARPDAPEWTAVEWWAAAAAQPATAATEAPVVRLVWRTPLAGATCTLYRQQPAADFRLVADGLTAVSLDVEDRWRFEYLDADVDPRQPYTYRADVTNAFGRTSRQERLYELPALGTDGP